MKGFTPTGRGPKMGHSFDSSFGFTGSSGKVSPVKPYMRSAPKPMQKAEGGRVYNRKSDDCSTIGRDEPSNQLDEETGGKTPLRPGFKKGGPLKKAMGGPVAAAKGGKMPKRSVGSFNRKPLVGRK